MQKAIHIEQTSNTIAKILSVAPIEAVEVSPNGAQYIAVEYVEPPALDSCLDIAYPLYKKDTATMFWMVVNYQNVATDMVLANQNLQLQVTNLQKELEKKNAEITALTTNQTFIEDCLVEVGQVVYA